MATADVTATLLDQLQYNRSTMCRSHAPGARRKEHMRLSQAVRHPCESVLGICTKVNQPIFQKSNVFPSDRAHVGNSLCRC